MIAIIFGGSDQNCRCVHDENWLNAGYTKVESTEFYDGFNK